MTDDGYTRWPKARICSKKPSRAKCEIGAVIVAESASVNYPDARVVSDKTFRDLASTETPQGVIALVRPSVSALAEMTRGDDALVVLLDGVQDPGNAGAIVRAAEAFGASGVVFLKGSVNPYNPKCIRGSAGSVFRVPLVASVEADEILGHTQIAWYAAMPRAQKLASDADLAAPCGMIIGSEGHGVSPGLAGRAIGLRIPTSGVESLNAAVAAGILLYEARRQRASGLVRGTQ